MSSEKGEAKVRQIPKLLLPTAKRLAEQEKREAALALLKRTEQKKQEKLKKHLDHKIDKEVQLMRQESLRKKKERLDQLYRLEKRREKATQEKLKLLQNASYDIYQRKVDLIRKLSEIEVKEQVNKIAQGLKRKSECSITHEELKEVVQKKQRAMVAEKIETERHLVQNDFANHFEAFTRVPIEEEEKETKQQMDEYLRGALEARKQAMIKSHEDAPQIYDSTMEDIIQQRQNEVTEFYNKKLHDNHLAKIQRLNHAKAVLQLSTEEISDLLECDVEVFETDIGIIDVENDKIRTLIANHEESMRRNLETFNKISEQLKQQIEHDKHSLLNTRAIIADLEEKRKLIREEERTLFGEDSPPTSLTALENRTIELKNESHDLKRKCEEMHDDLQNNINVEIEKHQAMYDVAKDETDIQEEKARIRTERVDLLNEELQLRTQALEILRNRIKELKETTVKLREEHISFKKRSHLEQNRRLSRIILNEDGKLINNQLVQKTQLEIELSQRSNFEQMKRLSDRLNRLQRVLHQKEINQSTLVETLAFLRAYLKKEQKPLPHQVLTKYKEDVDNRWMVLARKFSDYSIILSQVDAARATYCQRIRDLQARFAHSVYVREERIVIIGSYLESTRTLSSDGELNDLAGDCVEAWDEETVEMQLARISSALALEKESSSQCALREQRLLSLIIYLKRHISSFKLDESMRRVFENLARSKIEEYHTEHRFEREFVESELEYRRKTEENYEQRKRVEMITDVDEDRNKRRHDVLEVTQDIRTRLERYLNIQEATVQLNRRMIMVRKQKERKATLNNEVARIKKVNTRDSSSKVGNLYLHVNSLPIVEDPPTDSETMSEYSAIPLSDFSDIEEPEERKRIDEEKERLFGLGTFDPKAMLATLKHERNFVPDD